MSVYNGARVERVVRASRLLHKGGDRSVLQQFADLVDRVVETGHSGRITLHLDGEGRPSRFELTGYSPVAEQEIIGGA